MEQKTKICSKCKRELPIDNFYFHNKEKGQRKSQCKDCERQYKRRRKKEKLLEINSLKNKQGCAKCGEKRGYVLEFHHINPLIKNNSIAKIRVDDLKFSTIEQEIKKCIVLCANCHREFHWFENEFNMTIQNYLDNKYQLNGERKPNDKEGKKTSER